MSFSKTKLLLAFKWHNYKYFCCDRIFTNISCAAALDLWMFVCTSDFFRFAFIKICNSCLITILPLLPRGFTDVFVFWDGFLNAFSYILNVDVASIFWESWMMQVLISIKSLA